MRKKVGIIKRMLCICLVFLLSINSFAAIVSDNDGAAFITKAEFDALKNDFQSQIDSYNTSIDNKIDGAIAAYLAGIALAKVADCINLYETINIGGHSGYNLTFGNRAYYRASEKIIEMNQNLIAYVGTTKIPDTAISGRPSTKESWLKSIGWYTTMAYFPRAYANLGWVPKISSDSKKFLGVVDPNINFTPMSILDGASGYTSNYDDTTGKLHHDIRTWMNWSSYVNPFGLGINLGESGTTNGAKVCHNTSVWWDFVFAYGATSGDWGTKDTWQHDVDIICKSESVMNNELMIVDGTTNKINGTLAFGTTQPDINKRGLEYSQGTGYKVVYDGNALYKDASMYYFVYSKHMPTYGSTTGKIWTPGTDFYIDTDDRARYKSCAILVDTSGTDSAIIDKKINSLEWAQLTSVVPTCKNPQYGIPLYKCPGNGECELKIKLDKAAKVTMYTSKTANTTLTGGDTRLPKSTTYNANVEYTVKYNANKDDILFIYIVPTSTTWNNYVKIVSMSCKQNMET